LSNFRTIIRSPGIRYDLPGIQEAHEIGCNVTSMTKLTLEVASDRITAITGTNGKTTTTALVDQILTAHYGDRLIVGGNDRQPILQQAIENEKNPILIEASSFQFEDLKTSPYIAAILNITPNHLDWHDTLEAYITAKSNLLRHQNPSDWAVLNATDENVTKLSTSTPAQVFWIGEKKGDHWAVWEDGYLQLSFDGKVENVIHFDQLNVKTHPYNLLFAAVIAKLHQVPVSTIEEQIKLFKGVEHRLEFVRTLNDIHFYNDSSSTSPESAMAAIDQFLPHKLILMLGGSSKKADFTYLAKKIVKEGVRVFLYGAEKQRIKESILSAGGKELILETSEKTDFSH
ncbi:UDP-N-acetylmuramoyl-L-alanine--D-glutamate ligase, partial [Candidatus Pacearchaeota archaeon]|nr:UDP-N-acetylmuramoyl-L-alanine--D-glutamate ligase [Candidatus Pacearchaeota archaeon]